MFSLICVWINRWVNDHEAGALGLTRPLWRHSNDEWGDTSKTCQDKRSKQSATPQLQVFSGDNSVKCSKAVSSLNSRTRGQMSEKLYRMVKLRQFQNISTFPYIEMTIYSLSEQKRVTWKYFIITFYWVHHNSLHRIFHVKCSAPVGKNAYTNTVEWPVSPQIYCI